MLTFTVASNQITDVVLTLALNALPTLILEYDESVGLRQPLHSLEIGTECLLEWQDETITFQYCGYRQGTIVGIPLQAAVIEWLQAYPEVMVNHLIYQLQNSQDNILFLSAIFNHWLEVRQTKTLNDFLQKGMIFVRSRQESNQQYLQRFTSELQHHCPEILGWSIKQNEQHPLYFCWSSQDDALVLDDFDDTHISPLYSFSESANSLSYEFDIAENEQMTLLKSLIEDTYYEKASAIALPEADIFPSEPCDALLNKRPVFCQQITYHFSPNNRAKVKVEVKVRTKAPTMDFSALHQTQATVKAWNEDSIDFLQVQLSDNHQWGLMNEENPTVLHDSQDIYTHPISLMGKHLDEKYAGIYVHYYAGAFCSVHLQSFEIPTMIGTRQQKVEAFEATKATVINTENIKLSSSNFAENAEDMSGVMIKADSVTVKHTEKINIQVPEMVIEADDVQVEGTMRISEELEVG